MPRVDILKQTPIARSSRVAQLEAMFDVPRIERASFQFQADLPLDEKNWKVGLIVGPSGSGKTLCARELFPEQMNEAHEWRDDVPVIDNFRKDISMEQIVGVCRAVGFNTIPAWARPYNVLSNGEQFRVRIARALVEESGLIVIDEFTSVVDRQIAKITAHAVRKYIDASGKRFVGVSCHYDIVEWLRPDWLFDSATKQFEWTHGRWLQRPKIEITIARVPYNVWHVFAPYHYLRADLNRAAKCFALFVGDEFASFVAVLYRPHPRVRDVYGFSRVVTLPDWQGMGLIFVLRDKISSLYKAAGFRIHAYPAHPTFVRSFDRSANWVLKKRPGQFIALGKTSMLRMPNGSHVGARPCAIFEYAGPAGSRDDAIKLGIAKH